MAAIDRANENNRPALLENLEPKPFVGPLQNPNPPAPIMGPVAPVAQKPVQNGFGNLSDFEAPGLGKTNLTGTSRLEQARANAETAALGKMDSVSREKYLNTLDMMSNDPSGQSALRSLLLNGQLTKSNAFDGSGNLLDQVSKLADPNTQTIPGVDKGQLLSQTVKDVARPFSIDQGRGNYFCGATAALTGLAFRNPAEYARLAVGLGTEGKVELAGGYKKDDPEGAYSKGDHVALEVKQDALDDRGKSVTQKLLAPALTEYGNGDDFDVDAHSGVNHNRHNGREQHGLFGRQVADMQGALYGKGYDSFRVDHQSGGEEEQKSVQTAKDLVQQQVAQGVQVAIKIDEHWVNVTGFDGKNFSYTDSQGASKSIAADEVFKNTDAVTYERDAVDEPVASLAAGNQAPAGTEKPGGGTNTNTGSVDPDD